MNDKTAPSLILSRPAWKACGRRLAARFGRSDKGSIAVMFALTLPLIIATVGLGLEVGMWYQAKRDIQTMADAAAIAAAMEVAYDSGITQTELETAAGAEANRNGYEATSDTITVNNPPTLTSNTDFQDTAYVEVKITRQLTTMFAQILVMMDQTVVDPLISSTAVATVIGDMDACVLALSADSSSAINASGGADVTMSGCGVVANSNATNPQEAVYVSNNSSLTVDCLWTAGAIDGAVTTTDCDAPMEGTSTIDDPYSDLTIPDLQFTVAQDQTDLNAMGPGDTVTIGPGKYTGGISITNGTVIMSSGVYVMDAGDFKVNGGNVTGEGVTIILTSYGDSGASTGAISVAGNGVTDLRAQTTAEIAALISATTYTAEEIEDYAGILFYQDRRLPNASPNANSFAGTSDNSFEGAIYTPNNSIDFKGNTAVGAPDCLMLVGDTVSFSGSPTIGNDCDIYGGNPIGFGAAPGLVE